MLTRISTISFLVILVSTISQSLFADGCFVTDNYGADVYAPDQKVVISWDGKMETMILSTKVQSDELSNFGWIIPLRSTQKPEVELGDVQIFYEMSKYFNPPIYPSMNTRSMTLSAGGGFDRVEIIETKKLDIYDITILRSTDSEQLYQWFKINSFKVNENSKEILGFYATKDFFFITAKIDLQNKYKDELELLARPETKEEISKIKGEIKRSGIIWKLSESLSKDILLDKSYNDSIISTNDLNEEYGLLVGYLQRINCRYTGKENIKQKGYITFRKRR